MIKNLLASLLIILSLSGWTIKEAHREANSSSVVIGEWCSGTIIDKERGLVLTAAHCLEPITRHEDVNIELPNGQFITKTVEYYLPFQIHLFMFDDKGKQTGIIDYDVEVLGYDFPGDVAILKNTSVIKFFDDVPINNDGVEYGDKLTAIGNPYMYRQTITQGDVVNPVVNIDFGSGKLDVILTDILISPGSSGGGVYNENGELIGISNWTYQLQGIGLGSYSYISPIQNAINLMKRLKLV